MEVESETEIEIGKEIPSDFSCLKPDDRVIFRKDPHAVITVIIDLQNLHCECVRPSPVVHYRKPWYEQQSSEPELVQNKFCSDIPMTRYSVWNCMFFNELDKTSFDRAVGGSVTNLSTRRKETRITDPVSIPKS